MKAAQADDSTAAQADEAGKAPKALLLLGSVSQGSSNVR